jgi:hypothetical protein
MSVEGVWTSSIDICESNAPVDARLALDTRFKGRALR